VAKLDALYRQSPRLSGLKHDMLKCVTKSGAEKEPWARSIESRTLTLGASVRKTVALMRFKPGSS
jgi:hypothetical protein